MSLQTQPYAQNFTIEKKKKHLSITTFFKNLLIYGVPFDFYIANNLKN